MNRSDYVRSVLHLYRTLARPARKPDAADRRLARQLFDQHVDLASIEAAFLLATARRSFHPLDRLDLPPVRSLAYFLPVLHELQQEPFDSAYLDYLRLRLATSRSLFDGN